MPKSSWLVAHGAVILSLSACDRVAFDHSLDRQGLDGGQPESECRTALEGSACDDRDICTPRSVCRSGVCFGENPFDSCVVADTAGDFTSEQGGKGWWYGYWDAANDPDGKYDPASDFDEMEYCRENTWLPAGRCAASPEWTQNLSHALQHAETDPELELPVRRWVSDVSGPARISAEHYINGGKSGDGTRALLLLDGVEIWRSEVVFDGLPGRATLEVQLEQGSRVEQLLHPRESQAEDMTYFSVTIAP